MAFAAVELSAEPVSEYLDSLRAMYRADKGAAISTAKAWTPEQLETLDDGEVFGALMNLRSMPEPDQWFLRRCLDAALDTHATPLVEGDLAADTTPPPSFVSGLWERSIEGDGMKPLPFHGLTIMGGATGTGKSKLAVRVAIENARLGTEVLYCNAELDVGTLALYAHQVTGLSGAGLVAEYPNLTPLEVRRTGDEIDPVSGVLREIWNRIPPSVELRSNRPSVLVIVDTINTMAEIMGAPPGEFGLFRTINRLCLAFMEARKLSSGAISFLVISELNTSGKIKGGQLYTWADCGLHITPGEDTNTPIVHMAIPKGRYVGTRDLGYWRRNWRDCTFEQLAGGTDE